jgi:hypothetical protein
MSAYLNRFAPEPVQSQQRHTRRNRCPVCAGADGDRRGSGTRCHGFDSSDGRWVRCSREEFAGELVPDSAGLYAHRSKGPCKCGKQHASSSSRITTSGRTGTSGREAATYDYQSPAGDLLHQVVRYQPKGFTQRRPNGRGGWTYDLKGVERVLYHLPELLDRVSEIVFIVEGEKDADRLRRDGFLATTNAGGAGKWRAEYSEALRGRRTVILPDNDGPGRNHADSVATSLTGVAAEVATVALPGTRPGSDVSDWLDAGHSAVELRNLAAAALEDARSQSGEVHSATRSTGARLGLPEYLDRITQLFDRYVVFPSEHESVAISLWVAHAYLVELFETSPILSVTSAEMRSGKTRTLDVLELVVPHPFRMITPSEAVVYTTLSLQPRRTMLLDEADAIFGSRTAERYEGLRAIFNAGNRKGTKVPRVRMDGRRREVEEFDVYGPKVIAGIGRLPDTVTDRAIPICLKRRAPHEPVAKFRHRMAAAEAREVTFDPTSVTLAPDVPVPEELNDRAADSWEPLIAIAQAAGGAWPERARLASIMLSGEDETPTSVGMQLLADIREVFGTAGTLTTQELLHRLHDLDEAPWTDWHGTPLSARALAKLLEPYRVRPMQRRLQGEKSRGYAASDFTDAWTRYVAGQAGQAGPAPSEVDIPPLDLGLDPNIGFANDFDGEAEDPTLPGRPPAYGVAFSPPRSCPTCRKLHPVDTRCDWVGDPPADASWLT